MDIHRLDQTLAALPWIKYRFFSETTSTNDDVLEWLQEGCSEYSLVIADSQSKGRGRSQRRWITRAGSALAFSLALFPVEKEIERLALFSPLGALSVCQALEKCYALPAQIKWPNDVLVDRKKVCGILSEAWWHADLLGGLVMGIGVNVSRGAVSGKDLMQFPAISIEEVAGNPVDRVELLVAILTTLYHWRPLIGSAQFFDYWRDHLAFRDERVTVHVNEKESASGFLRGVAQDGSLEIELGSGRLASFLIGDVHLRSGDESC